VETKITEKINQKIDELNRKSIKDNKFDTKLLKDEMKFITNESVKEIKKEFSLTDELKYKMSNYKSFPAFYILIFSLVISKAQSIISLTEFSKRIYIPEDWEVGLERLFQDEIIVGNNDSFSINSKYKEQLENWASENRNSLILLRQQFRRKKESPKDFAESYSERIHAMVEKIKL
jgi:hypothetical protein